LPRKLVAVTLNRVIMNFKDNSIRTSLGLLILFVVLGTGFFVTAVGNSCYLDVTRIPVIEYCPASANNYSRETRSREEIDYIVIHTVQGSLDSAIHTFSSPDLGYPRSAHYTVGPSGEVVKSVPASKVAWHAGTSPIGSGGKHESRVLNSNSIGIEHGGYVDDPNFPTQEQYIASAALTRYLCELYDIPLNRRHIVGHDEIKSTKGDPGPNWDWSYYMNLVRNGTRQIPGQQTEQPVTVLNRGSSLFSSGLVVIGAAVAVLGFLNMSS
jgi:N-acetyl-anhydromuramyl-L-alanine amidase AmpD